MVVPPREAVGASEEAVDASEEAVIAPGKAVVWSIDTSSHSYTDSAI